MISRIDQGKNDLEIIQDFNIANIIHWLQVAWRDVSTETIINSFQKGRFPLRILQQHSNDNETDKESKNLLIQLCEDGRITV